MILWRFDRSAGVFSRADGSQTFKAYSGHGEGVNNPALECVPNVGPIPRGRYVVGAAFTDGEKGPLVMRLTPIDGTDTHGRSGFLIHGDSIAHPGTASHGCVILAHDARECVAHCGDSVLEVV